MTRTWCIYRRRPLLVFWKTTKSKYLENVKRERHLKDFLQTEAVDRRYSVKTLCWNLFFNKVADLRPATLIKKRLQHKCFSKNTFFCRTPPVAASVQILHESDICMEKIVKKRCFYQKIISLSFAAYRI